MDERIRFYLRHREQIEEWRKVGQVELPKFTHEFYAGLVEVIPNQVHEDKIDVDHDMKIALDGGGRAINLRRRDWPTGDGAPVVLLGWPAGANFSSDPARPWKVQAWCGICVERYTSRYWEQLCGARNGPLGQHYPGHDRSYGYPMFRYVEPPSGNFWEDDNLEAYGRSLIQTLLKAWQDLTSLVDKAVRH